jgi:hypothetical protein
MGNLQRLKGNHYPAVICIGSGKTAHFYDDYILKVVLLKDLFLELQGSVYAVTMGNAENFFV